MEGEGSGYDLMYETQLSLGKSIPTVREGEDSVSVTVERKIVSREASRIYDYLGYAYPEIIHHQKAMIAFGLILQEEIIGAEADIGPFFVGHVKLLNVKLGIISSAKC